MILDKNKNKSCQNEPKLSAKIYIYWKFQLSLTRGTQKPARIPKKVILSSVKQKLFQNPAVLIMNGLYNIFFWTNPRAQLIFVFWFFFQDHSGPCLTKAYMVQTSINCVNNKENPRCCRHQSLHSVSLMVHWIEKVFRNNFSFSMQHFCYSKKQTKIHKPSKQWLLLRVWRERKKN